MRQGGRRDRAQPGLRPGPGRRAHDLSSTSASPTSAPLPPCRPPPRNAMQGGRTQYTHATGLPALRERIAGWYATRFGVVVDPACIVITAGASAALQLACLALFEPGDEVLMPDPSYPCNRHFVAAVGGTGAAAAHHGAGRYQLDAASVAAPGGRPHAACCWRRPATPRARPSHRPRWPPSRRPCAQRGGVSLIDEIYLGLSFEAEYGHSALALRGGRRHHQHQQLFQVLRHDRLAPGLDGGAAALVAPIDKLAQNLYICASTRGAACGAGLLRARLHRRIRTPPRRIPPPPRLHRAGPAGSWACPCRCCPTARFTRGSTARRHNASSWDFCFDMMRRAHVALTPGRDFGPGQAERFVRLSFASGMPQLQAAVARLAREFAR
jgi:aspartate/methionine/tyrosine aminotransferase